MKSTLPHYCAAVLLGLTALAGAQDDHNHGPGERGQGQGQRQGGPGGPGGFQGPGSLSRNPITKALDKDENGELSAEEIAGASAALLALDKNGDGKLSGEEIRPVRMQRGDTAQQTAHQTIENFDKNKDGKLSADELPERMKGLIERQDLDKDGFVTEEEIVKNLEKEKAAAEAAAAASAAPAGEKKP